MPGTAHGHVWLPHRGRYRCSVCRLGIHPGLPWRTLKGLAKAPCPGRKVAKPDATKVHWQPEQDKPFQGDMALSKPNFYEILVAEPTAFPNEHEWQWSGKATGVSYQQCRAWISKGFSWKMVRELVTGPCVSAGQQPPKNVKLHTSHEMVQRQQRWTYAKCRASMSYKEGKWQFQSPLYKKCEGQVVENSQSKLGQFFGSQAQSPGSASAEPSPESLLSTESGCVEVDYF